MILYLFQIELQDFFKKNKKASEKLAYFIVLPS